LLFSKHSTGQSLWLPITDKKQDRPAIRQMALLSLREQESCFITATLIILLNIFYVHSDPAANMPGHISQKIAPVCKDDE